MNIKRKEKAPILDTFNCEDCSITMQRMVDSKIKADIILTSPPYNTGKAGTTEAARNNFDGKYDIYLDTKSVEQYIDWTIKLFRQFDCVLQKNGVICYNMSYGSNTTSADSSTVNLVWLVVAEIIKNTPFMVADRIIWKKNNALPNNVSSNKLTRLVEDVFIFVRKNEYRTFYCNKEKTSVSKVGQQFYKPIYNFIEAPNNDGVCKFNKATFSSQLVTELLDIYCPVGGLTYDPFMGSGTTAVGCYLVGDHFIGSEISHNQVEFSKNRLKEVGGTYNETRRPVKSWGNNDSVSVRRHTNKGKKRLRVV